MNPRDRLAEALADRYRLDRDIGAGVGRASRHGTRY